MRIFLIIIVLSWVEGHLIQMMESGYAKCSDGPGTAASIDEVLYSWFIPLMIEHMQKHFNKLFVFLMSKTIFMAKALLLLRPDNHGFLLDQAIVTQNFYISPLCFHYFIIKVKVILISRNLKRPLTKCNYYCNFNKSKLYFHIVLKKYYSYIKQGNAIQKQIFFCIL